MMSLYGYPSTFRVRGSTFSKASPLAPPMVASLRCNAETGRAMCSAGGSGYKSRAGKWRLGRSVVVVVEEHDGLAQKFQNFGVGGRHGSRVTTVDHPESGEEGGEIWEKMGSYRDLFFPRIWPIDEGTLKFRAKKKQGEYQT
jgi:hypothetical protein